MLCVFRQAWAVKASAAFPPNLKSLTSALQAVLLIVNGLQAASKADPDKLA